MSAPQITIKDFSGKMDYLFEKLKNDQKFLNAFLNSKDAHGYSLTQKNLCKTLGRSDSQFRAFDHAKNEGSLAYGFWLDTARLFGFGPTLPELQAGFIGAEDVLACFDGKFTKSALKILDIWAEVDGPRQRVFRCFAGLRDNDKNVTEVKPILRGAAAAAFKTQFQLDLQSLEFQPLEFSFSRHPETAKSLILGLSCGGSKIHDLNKGEPFLLTKEHFLERPETHSRATEYLRGQAPTFDVIANASARRRGVETLVERINGTTQSVVVHAPTADGLTTFLMQVAQIVVSQDIPVYWAHGGKWKPSDAIVTSPHILFIDDIHLMSEIPSELINAYGYGPNKVIFGVRTYRLHELRSKSLHILRDLPIPRVTPDDTSEFTSLVITYDAADKPDVDIKKLFIDEIKKTRKGQGSLFPAMYAATRGELLEERFNRILDELDSRRDKQLALATLVYSNFKSKVREENYQLKRRQPPVSYLKMLAKEVNKAIDCAPSTSVVSAVDNLRVDWDGELHPKLNGGLEIRHEAIAEVLFRWLFGAATRRDNIQRGRERYNKWLFALEEGKLAHQYNGVDGVTPAGFCLQDVVSTARWDNEKGVPLDSDDVIEVIQELDILFQHAKEGTFEAHWLNAYSSTEIAHLVDKVVERTQHFENAVSGLQAALNLPKLNYKQISQIADVLSRNGLNEPKLELDGDEYTWLGLKGLSISKATTDDDKRFAEFETFKSLNQLLKVKPRGKVEFGYPRFLAIADLFSSSHKAIASIHVEKRLEIMLRLHRWAFMQYREEKEVPEGTFEDPVPDSRRAISMYLWRAVQSAHTANILKRLMNKQMYKGLLNSAMKREVDHIAKFEGYSHPLSTKLSELEHFSKSGDAATFAARFVEGL